MTATAATSTLAKDLEAIVGAEHIAPGAPLKPEGAPSKPGFGLGGGFPLTIDDVVPQFVVTPANPQEVAEVLKYARAHHLVVVPAGGFTQQGTGAIPPRVDIIIRTTRLTAVEHYDPGDLTIGIGAGATIAAIERIVGEHEQMFALDPWQLDRTTIGGALATNAHGPLKHGYGGLRDFCTGVRFVTSDGKIAKGGVRVVKNVAGYDMMKLLIGSYGTLAVITSASFKVFPRPRQTGTFLAVFDTLAEIIAFRDRLLRSPLTFMAMEVISPHVGSHVGSHVGCPTLVAPGVGATGWESDAEFTLGGLLKPAFGLSGDHWTLLLRAAGSDAVLARYRRELGSAVTREVTAGDNDLWRSVARMPHDLVERSRNAMLLRVDVAIQGVEGAITAAERAATDSSFVCATMGRVGMGALILAFVPVAQPVATHYANAVSAFRASLPRDASAVVLHCPTEAKPLMSVWGSSPTDLDAMRAIKHALDDQDILNRGRFLF